MAVSKMLPSNLFGKNLPLDDLDRAAELLGIGAEDRVLDLGGAANPLPRANVVCDLSFASSTQRNGAPTTLRDGVAYVEAPAEELPFPDGHFDFVWCTQVLEHVRDPARAVAEINRVAKRGFIEVPSRLGELLNGNPSHRWIIDREGPTLVFRPRRFVEHPLRNFLYSLILKDPGFRELVESRYRNLFNHQLRFEHSDLACRVDRPAGNEALFDYDDPAHAARAHYSFARNVLAFDGDPSYVYPDALEAQRLAPDSNEARRLLAVTLARLERDAEARKLLEQGDGPQIEALRSILEKGETPPLPPPELQASSSELPATRPEVSVIVVGEDPEALRDSVRSALIQDYPRVEVVVAAPLDAQALDALVSGLEMGDRLRCVPLGAGATPGTCFNQGAGASRGSYLAFLEGGERFASHHVDRLMAHLVAGDAEAVHSDRLLLADGSVAGPQIRPGEPETAAGSISTLLAPRDLLHRVGLFKTKLREGVGLDYLVRLAAVCRLGHLEEVSVESSLPIADRAGLMSLAQVADHRIPMELGRSLMAAYQREKDLRARVAELEARLAEREGSKGS